MLVYVIVPSQGTSGQPRPWEVSCPVHELGLQEGG